MFPTLSLFQTLPCPEKPHCKRPNCLFSHRPDVTQIPVTPILVEVPKPSYAAASTSAPQITAEPTTSIPAKRSISSPLRATAPGDGSAAREPPRKLQRTGPPQRPVAVPSAPTTSSTGVPVLKITPAQSQVALPVRQAMLKTLYDHFVVLYERILTSNPTLASDHALKQEQEVYLKSNKLTYRNAVISSVAALKKRPKPDHASHPSVGTEGELQARAELRKKMDALKLTVSQLEPYVLSEDQMKTWGYVVEIPPGPGGDKPHEEGSVMTCERCTQKFVVKRCEEADQCRFHWGKAFTSRVDGERRRLYTCCSRTADEEGCATGPHVFYEKDPGDLHRRHAFTHSRPPQPAGDTALDIVALDCEMIYTTGGMRVARVSVINSSGKEVLDELVRMDEGVEVIDFNTRFSGITPEKYASAVLPLVSVRQSLDELINSQTIIIGHALENDLKTMRMIHHRCVDTAILFPHPGGPPYRRALRTLTKEHLGKTIQSAGAAGHSSIEDSVATLDLVRWHVINGPKPKPKPVSTPTTVGT
ncbi:ribonuclease H-like protein [Fomes fomentarius]|nr:ribonuclease H-like protein [Fomes fomentarius]